MLEGKFICYVTYIYTNTRVFTYFLQLNDLIYLLHKISMIIHRKRCTYGAKFNIIKFGESQTFNIKYIMSIKKYNTIFYFN